MTSTTARNWTDIDRLAEAYQRDSLALSPLGCTYLGQPGSDHLLDDHSPAGIAKRADLAKSYLTQARALEPTDDVDRATRDALTENLEALVDLCDNGEELGDLNVIASPAQGLRSVFDIMPKTSVEQWENIAARLRALPEALAGYRESLSQSVAHGTQPARRQIERVADQAGKYSSDTGFFATFGESVPGDKFSAAVQQDVRAAAAEAAQAYREFGAYLSEELLPHGRVEDAFGPERLALHSRRCLGAKVDLREAYEWGLAELASIEESMATVAQDIVPGGTVRDAVAALDADPSTTVDSPEAFREWMQEQADMATEEMVGVYFDIPEKIRAVECKVAPIGPAAMYYNPPSEDFSRPGTVWWTPAPGAKTFSTWRNTTIVFHEGVPGHHLQFGQTMCRQDQLNRWRRTGVWLPGYGEGWALYAERLMSELGYLDDPGDRLGWLEGSALRACRVVVDLGVHCQFEAPAEVGGGTWNADKAWDFLRTHSLSHEDFLGPELDRYLGWPGQASTYKLGEREWLRIRRECTERDGADFDLKAFHRKALDAGALPFRTLRMVMGLQP